MLLLRATLTLTGAVVFLTSLTMAGLVGTYQLRWKLDEKQVAAMRPVLASLPPTTVVVVTGSVRRAYGEQRVGSS